MSLTKNPVASAVDQSGDRMSQMAHEAATKMKIRAALSTNSRGAAPAPSTPHGGSYKDHIANTLGLAGIKSSHDDIHRAIGQLQAAGHFAPPQAEALLKHNGPLMGPQGLSTAAAIGNVVAMNKKQAMQGAGGPPMMPHPQAGPPGCPPGAPGCA